MTHALDPTNINMTDRTFNNPGIDGKLTTADYPDAFEIDFRFTYGVIRSTNPLVQRDILLHHVDHVPNLDPNTDIHEMILAALTTEFLALTFQEVVNVTPEDMITKKAKATVSKTFIAELVGRVLTVVNEQLADWGMEVRRINVVKLQVSEEFKAEFRLRLEASATVDAELAKVNKEIDLADRQEILAGKRVKIAELDGQALRKRGEGQAAGDAALVEALKAAAGEGGDGNVAIEVAGRIHQARAQPGVLVSGGGAGTMVNLPAPPPKGTPPAPASPDTTTTPPAPADGTGGGTKKP